MAWSWDRKQLNHRLLSKGFKTKGKVIELLDHPDTPVGSPGTLGQAPTVEYHTVSGNLLKHVSTTYQSPSPYEIGQEVDIWYKNYKSIREATLADDKPDPFLNVIFRLGLILIMIGIPFLLNRMLGLI